MKLAQIVISSSIIVSGICFAVTLLPNFFGPFGAVEHLWGRKKLKKKRARKRDGSVFVMYSDTDDSIQINFLIPEIQNRTGIKAVTIRDGDQLGRSELDLVRELIRDSSITLILLTEDLMNDQWFEYAIAISLQKDADSIVLCHDEKFNIKTVSHHLQDAFVSGCRTISFCTKQFKDPHALNQIAEKISKTLVNANDNVMVPLIPNLPTDFKNVLKYDMFVIHDLKGIAPCHQMPCMDLEKPMKQICSADTTPGTYIYQACSSAIRSSRHIVFVLTPQMLKSPYFDYQLRLALYYKGHQSITFVVTEHCLNCLPDDKTFRYAIASCRKIYRK